MSKFFAKKNNVEAKGVCLRLHGTHLQRRRIDKRGQEALVEAPSASAGNRRRQQRQSTRTQSTRTITPVPIHVDAPFVAEPAGGAQMNCHARHPSANKEELRKKRKASSLDAIRSADLGDRDTQRAVLSLLSGKEESKLNLLRGGKTSCAQRRAENTIGAAANSLVHMVSMNAPQRADSVRERLSEVATKRATAATTATTAAPAGLSKATAAQMQEVCGSALRQQILRESGMQRRPFLAVLAEFRKPDVEKFLGITRISDKEWNLVRLHARYPGPFKSVSRAETFRCRIPEHLLQSMLSFFEDSENTQRLAFGQAVRTIQNNGKLALLDNVQLMQSIRRTAIKFVLAMADELDSLSAPDVDEVDCAQRCTSVESSTFRRCRQEANHDGKCSFTSKGCISVNAASDLVRSLSDQEIKSLSGLDDTKTIQGRDNFIRIRKLIDRLWCNDQEQKKLLKQQVDETESFHKCNFMGHLLRIGSCRCNCLTCGFNDPKNPCDIVCSQRDQHGRCCIDCVKGFAVLENLQDRLQQLQNEKPMTECSLSELELFSECEHELQLSITDLREYRSHLARHKAEGDFANGELQQLRDDEAQVTSDYKMKILAAFFRMNQKKWFGQRGITGLGFMIAYNNPSDRATKSVKFLMMLTDDTLQDAEQVICAKQYVYTNELPPWITRVRFRSDGAGCYKAQIHRVLQPYWSGWTGITEVAYSIDPAGAGKSALDGKFGRFGQVVKTAVDGGRDVTCKDDLLDLFDGETDGVTALKLLGFSPDRTKLPDCTLSVSTESILHSKLDEETGQIRMYKHSSFGEGTVADLYDSTIRPKNKPSETLVFARNLVAEIEYWLAGDDGVQLIPAVLQSASGHALREWSFAACGVSLIDRFKPQCIEIRETDNRKQELPGAGMSCPGEGDAAQQQRQAKRVKRKAGKCDSKKDAIDKIREEKENRGVFCCPNRCPTTGRYCTSQFLSAARRDRHALTDKQCSFPTGITGRDKLIHLASSAGGVLELGSRPNRLAGGVSNAIVQSEDGAAGEVAADCFQRFNRKEGVPPYRKPKKLVDVLKELFDVRPKLDEKQIRERMKAMRDADGTLTFCYQKRGTSAAVGVKKNSADWKAWAGCQECGKKPCDCNGMLLSEEQIKAWVHQETQRRKKKR